MAESIYKLFDYQAPENIRAAYLDNLLVSPDRMAGMDLYSQLAATGTNVGGLLGASLGRMAGYVPAGEAKAQAIDQIMGAASKASSDPLGQAQAAYELFQKNGMAKEAEIALERVTELQKEKQAQGFTGYMAAEGTQFKTPEDYYKASKMAFAAGDQKSGISMMAAGQTLAKELEDKEKKAAITARRLRAVQAQSPDLPAEVAQSVAADEELYKEWGKTLFAAKEKKNNVSYQDIDGFTTLLVTDQQGNLVNRLELGKASQKGTNVSVNTGTTETAGQKAKGDVLGKGVGEDLLKTRLAAQSANETLPKMYEALNILKTKDLNTGLGYSLYDIIDQVRSQYLNDKQAGRDVTNNQYLDSLIGSDVFNAIADLGIGARGIDTPAEKEFLLEVVTGKRSLNKDALIKITEMRIKNTERSVKRFNEYLSKGDYKDLELILGRKLDPIELRNANQTPSVSNW